MDVSQKDLGYQRKYLIILFYSSPTVSGSSWVGEVSSTFSVGRKLTPEHRRLTLQVGRSVRGFTITHLHPIAPHAPSHPFPMQSRSGIKVRQTQLVRPPTPFPTSASP